MAFSVNINNGTFVLVITGDMTVSSLLDMKESILEGITGVEKVEFDLSGVEDMDSAGFQILYAVKKYAETNGQEFRISAYSSSVVTYLDTYNMHDYFAIGDVSPSEGR